MPYVSDFFKMTVRDNAIPVVGTDIEKELDLYSGTKIISENRAIESNLEKFTDFAGKIGDLAGVKNFPVHIELRRDNDGILLPIEVNPMRFGGWCTTADISFLAYGFNPYLYYVSVN